MNYFVKSIVYSSFFQRSHKIRIYMLNNITKILNYLIEINRPFSKMTLFKIFGNCSVHHQEATEEQYANIFDIKNENQENDCKIENQLSSKTIKIMFIQLIEVLF